MNTSSFIGGVLNNNVSETNGYRMLRQLTGKNTLICGEQWDVVYSKLADAQARGEFEDKWEFSDAHSFGHLKGVAVSGNPSDPQISLDPWVNEFKVTHPSN
ncbi:hypothetical protein [Halopseudomonas salegens]|uniref:hypothetical protein n=1 Tax=Halopseudomonas salegens TaxID=1434072 RepID=UPI0012FD0CD3|nr:hypothetical protein [Halopseudomonas salegens]